MCWGCLSYKSASDLLQKQLDFLNASPHEQIKLAKNNKPYDPNAEFNIMNENAGVSNLLPINEWNKDKLFLYIYLSNGLKGRIASYKAMKLIIMYEQWLSNATLEKQEEYKKLHDENITEWKRIDTWFIKQDTKERNYHDELYKNIITEQLKQLDELYTDYTDNHPMFFENHIFTEKLKIERLISPIHK